MEFILPITLARELEPRLIREQGEDGGFISYRAEKPDMRDAQPFTSPFLAAFALEGLAELRILLRDKALDRHIHNSVAWLMQFEESDGLYRFFGPGTHLPLDTDDTACIWAARIRAGESAPASVFNRLNAIRTTKGAFQTWVPDAPDGVLNRPNDIDIHVNANAIFLYALAGRNIKRACSFLRNSINDGRWKQMLLYYPDDAILLAGFMARPLSATQANFKGREDLNEALRSLAPAIRQAIWKEESNALRISAALAAASVLGSVECGETEGWEATVLRAADRLLHILSVEEKFLAPMFPGQPGLHYGSTAATLGWVAIACGAWSRYRALRLNTTGDPDDAPLRGQLSYQNRLHIEKKAEDALLLGTEWLPFPPTELIVEVTNTCNLACPVCITGRGELQRPGCHLDLGLFRRIIDEIGGSLLTISLFNYGEPFLHPCFLDLIAIARRTDAHLVSCTNGTLLTEWVCRGIIEKGLDQLVISLDGLDDESVQAYRGPRASATRIIKGIERLVRLKRELGSQKPRVVLQMILMKSTERFKDSFYDFAYNLGVDEAFIKGLIVDLDDQPLARRLLPSDHADWHRYTERDGRIAHIGTDPKQCPYLFRSLTLLADGRVVPCCYDGRAQMVLGDSNKQTMAEIWNSKAIRDFRVNFSRVTTQLSMCRMCPVGRISSIKVSEKWLTEHPSEGYEA